MKGKTVLCCMKMNMNLFSYSCLNYLFKICTLQILFLLKPIDYSKATTLLQINAFVAQT